LIELSIVFKLYRLCSVVTLNGLLTDMMKKSIVDYFGRSYDKAIDVQAHRRMWIFPGYGSSMNHQWTRDVLKKLEKLTGLNVSSDLILDNPFCDCQITVERTFISAFVSKDEKEHRYPKFFEHLTTLVTKFVQSFILR
jgi:hypothetical protein